MKNRSLIEDAVLLRTKWNPGSEYPLKAQAAWLEAVERAIEAEAKVEQLIQVVTEKDKELKRLKGIEAALQEFMHSKSTTSQHVIDWLQSTTGYITP